MHYGLGLYGDKVAFVLILHNTAWLKYLAMLSAEAQLGFSTAN